MADEAEFEYLEVPRQFSVEDIEGAHLEAFVITGIVNPYGPTLNVLATVGKSQSRPLIHAMLNPFSCEVRQVGTFTDGDRWFPDQVFPTLFQFLSGSCPTLVLTTKELDADTRSRLTENLFSNFHDAEHILERVRKFFANPMDRVSQAIGIEVPSPNAAPVEIQNADWSAMVSDTRHVWPEFRAFMVAWDGSINQTEISDQMKYGALQTDRMKSIVFPMLESVWMPEPQKIQAPPTAGHERPLATPQNYEEIRQMLLDRGRWENLRGDNLLRFMEWSMLLYGGTVDGSLVPHLSSLYNHIRVHSDPEHRKLQLQNISLAAEKYGLAACALLPPLVCDDDPWVVSTAMIDYIALCRPDPEGLPLEFQELDGLFRSGTFDCPGGALGGLITCGDRRFHPKIHDWKQHLTKDQIKAATNCQTPFSTHGEISFWLDWADSLVGQRDYESEGILGLVASAVGNLGAHDSNIPIQDVERRFHAHDVEKTVVELRSWSHAEYAEEIANRLYLLEATELAPKVFSAVLRAWGLEPRADLMDQFIPEERRR